MGVDETVRVRRCFAPINCCSRVAAVLLLAQHRAAAKAEQAAAMLREGAGHSRARSKALNRDNDGPPPTAKANQQRPKAAA